MDGPASPENNFDRVHNAGLPREPDIAAFLTPYIYSDYAWRDHADPEFVSNAREDGHSFMNNVQASGISSDEPLNLSVDRSPTDRAQDERSGARVRAQQFVDFTEFWHGTLREIQDTISTSNISSASSSSDTDMTEASTRSPPSWESAPNSPLPESGQNSPSRVSRPNTPLRESGQNSPVHESGQNSPVHESGQNSPVRESGQNSPVRESAPNSPVRESGQNSPPHEPIRLMFRRVNRRSSPSQESGSYSPVSENESIYTAEPAAKVRKLNSPTPELENDGETCPICLDTWGNSGDHRLVALRCGHLFGSKCVERWIRGKNTKERCCPTCKTKAAIKDIRYIYAKKLVAVDTTELTALQNQVQAAQKEKNQIEMELQTTKIEHHSLTLQLELLRKTLAASAGKQQPRRNWRFALDKNLEVWRDGGCRVLAYNCRTYEFYVSQKTTNNLFPGYGVRPVSCIDYKLGPFIPLHPKAIRDVAYSQPTDLLMSVGLDGAVKIVERGILTTSIQCKMPLWSCTWDHVRSNRFYIGAVGGLIMSYDVRNTNAVIETMSTPGDMSPSVSLVSTEYGLLSCQLNSAWLWRNMAAGTSPQPLPLKGPFVSLCYDQESKRIAVSCRPTQTERAKVVLYKINRDVSNEISFDLTENMFGSSRSTVMSRAAFVKCTDSAWVASYSESDSALLLHPIDGGRTMSLPAAEPALDVCAGVVNGETILAALSDSRMRLYKSYPTSSYS